MKKIIVFYHRNCLDGFGAAWAAWKKLGKKADYIGLEPRSPAVPKLKNKEIYFLDICSGEKDLRRLASRNRVVLIDHHLSRKKMARRATEAVFSLNHSGSVLAWKYFHPGKSLPKLLEFIEDYDLWKFRLRGTKELLEGVWMRDLEFNLWNKIASDFETAVKRRKYFEEGIIITKAGQKIVKNLVAASERVIFEGSRALAVNSPLLESEIGNYICAVRKYPLGIIWSLRNGNIEVSLRSDGKIDVSKIARKYGGGGHRRAAGFSLRNNIKFPWKDKGLL